MYLWTELGCVLASLTLFWTYLRGLRRDATSNQPRTASGVMAPLRIAWLEDVIRSGRDLSCIQTLRNWTMSASLMASTAMLGGVAAMGFALSHDGLPPVVRALRVWLPVSATPGPVLFSVKVFCLAAAFFFSFFHFSSALRYYSHVLVCVTGSAELERRVAVARQLIARGATHQSTGARSLYASAAVALWTVGAPWLLLGTLVTVILLRKLDAFDAR
jgi:uncharacterized membrane protein